MNPDIAGGSALWLINLTAKIDIAFCIHRAVGEIHTLDVCGCLESLMGGAFDIKRAAEWFGGEGSCLASA